MFNFSAVMSLGCHIHNGTYIRLVGLVGLALWLISVK